MIERTQPVVTGVNKKGEFIWGVIPMPRWQMEMFRIQYAGDFLAYWLKKQFEEKTGFEIVDPDYCSMELRSYKSFGRKRWTHQGD